jgi:hypothetical protein
VFPVSIVTLTSGGWWSRETCPILGYISDNSFGSGSSQFAVEERNGTRSEEEVEVGP